MILLILKSVLSKGFTYIIQCKSVTFVILERPIETYRFPGQLLLFTQAKETPNVINLKCIVCIYFYTDLHSFINKANHSAHSSTGTNTTTSFNSRYLLNEDKYSLDPIEAF
jgi:hypothetical protein